MGKHIIDVTLRLRDLMTGNLKDSNAALKDSANQWKRAGGQIVAEGKKMAAIGSGMTKSFSVPIAGIAVAAVKTAAGFETSMSQVAATMGKTSEEVKKLGLTDLAEEMGRTTAFTASEAADGINILAQAGLNASQITDALGTTLDLAAAGAISMDESAQYVTATVAGFNDEMKNASKYSDLIAKGAVLAKTDVTGLGSALGDVSATAAAYNQTATGTTTALLRLAQANVVGTEASTGLAAAMTRVYAPTDKAAKAMKELGVDAYDKTTGKAKDFNQVVQELKGALGGMSQEESNAFAKTIFGTNRLSIFNAMCATSAETVKDWSNQLEKSGGSAKQMAETQLDNLNGQITLLKSGLEGAAISLGNRLLPQIKQGVSFVQGLTDRINGLNDKQLDSIVKMAKFVATVGPVLTIVGKLGVKVGTTIRTIGRLTDKIRIAGGMLKYLASPAGVAVVVMGAVAIAAILVIKNWDKIHNAGKKVWGYITGVFGKVGEASGALNSKLGPIGERFDSIKGHIQLLHKTASPILNAIGGVFKMTFGTILGAAAGGAIGFLSSILSTTTSVVNGIMRMLDGLIQFVTGIFTGNWQMAWNGIKDIFGGAFQALGALAKAPMNAVIGIINGAVAGINKLGIDIPEWVPGLGGKKFSISIPMIPQLYKGTNSWKGGIVQINERGGEIVDLPTGSRVYPHDKSVRKAYNDGARNAGRAVNVTIAKLADEIIVREEADIDRVAERMADKLEAVAQNIGGGDIEYSY